MYRRLVLALFLCACGTSEPKEETKAATGTPGGTNPCQAGFAPDPEGLCIEIVANECGPGTMPEIGHPDCQPVGWTSTCPPGFERDGWSCVDEVPSSCPVATREDIASGACVAVGDCNAPFPPPNATLFVSTNGPVDATHFQTLAAATAAAPAGAVIAIEAGTYSEVLEIESRPISIVGRCAEKVVFKSPGGPRAGLFLKNVSNAAVRGVTITGFIGGVLAENADATLEDVVVRDNTVVGAFLKLGSHVAMRRSKLSDTTFSGNSQVGGGIVVYDGSTLALEDSAVTDNYFRNATVTGDGSRLDAKNVFFARNTKFKASEIGGNLHVNGGGALSLSRSIVTDSEVAGLYVLDEGTTVDVDESIVRRPRGALKDNAGIGILAADDATVNVRSSAITEAPVLGVYVDTKAHLTIQHSVFLGPPPNVSVEFGRGLQTVGGATADVRDTAFIRLPQSGIGVQRGGIGTFDRTYVREAYAISENGSTFGGFGILVEKDSKAKITRSSFESDALAGIGVNSRSVVTAEAVLVRDTKQAISNAPGSALQLSVDSSLSAIRSAFVRNTGTTAIVVGSTLALTDSSMRATSTRSDNLFGHAASIFKGGRLELLRTSVTDSAGVGVIAAGGQAWIRESTFARNVIAVHAQDGSSLVESDDDMDLVAGELRVSTDTRFVGNGSRVGSGEIPVPKVRLE